MLDIILISSEAVEESRAARSLQCFLTAAARWVRRIPRGIAAAVTVMMADLRAALAAARPVTTSMINIIGEVCRSVLLGTCQNVVLIRLVITTLHRSPLFVESRPLEDIRADV